MKNKKRENAGGHMLKRLAVFTDGGAIDEAAAKAAQAQGVQLQFISGSAEFPPGTPAAIALAKDLAGSIKAALTAAEQQEELLFLLADSLDCREGLLPGSSRRVTEHATRLSAAIGLGTEDQLVLERAALLRDIGKITIPNDVLLKEGLLSYEEWMFIQQHPHLGGQIVENTRALKDIAEVVRTHHESFDGDGYPDALEGSAIPLLARALKILDVYCAMTSPRHYRKGYSSQEEALEYIRSEQGKHFDPDLVETFLEAGVGRPWEPTGRK
ncbi:MAG: HD domain-containing protein [Candidatus Hydrogenedentes bacterium]|nr:HD domain-containing protein [Candidatus Hydrogenedentota bacterium]